MTDFTAILCHVIRKNLEEGNRQCNSIYMKQKITKGNENKSQKYKKKSCILGGTRKKV